MSNYPSGLRFPMSISPAGGFGIVQGANKVTTNLKALVTSAVKERLIYKRVGTVGYQAVLRTIDPGFLSSIVREAITALEPRATKVKVSVSRREIDTGMKVTVTVAYVFKFTGEPDTMTIELS